ncbi:MAG: FHA domain-containing protein [Streptosporangiaceae bacterium]
MSEPGGATRRPARASLSPRSRRRWQIAAGVAACWVVLFAVSGSVTGATVLLIVLAAFAVVAFFGLRALGVTRDHPWIQRIAARPWRDGQEVLRIALKHLPEVFVVTPSGSLLAPNIVELRMNPEDLRSLGERMEPALVMESATEVYLEQVQEHGARFARPAPAEVRMIVDPSVLPGRYRLRQGQPAEAGLPGTPGPQLAYAGAAPAGPDSHVGAYPAGPDSHVGAYPAAPDGQGRPTPAFPEPQVRGYPAGDDGATAALQDRGWSNGFGVPTVLERTGPAIPVLRLVTGDEVAETRTSGARAGRGPVELVLPEVPTVSREHARFTCSGGQWRIANLGMNGLTVNGEPVTGEAPVSDGDVVRWGTRPDALSSRVEIR